MSVWGLEFGLGCKVGVRGVFSTDVLLHGWAILVFERESSMYHIFRSVHT